MRGRLGRHQVMLGGGGGLGVWARKGGGSVDQRRQPALSLLGWLRKDDAFHSTVLRRYHIALVMLSCVIPLAPLQVPNLSAPAACPS